MQKTTGIKPDIVSTQTVVFSIEHHKTLLYAHVGMIRHHFIRQFTARSLRPPQTEEGSKGLRRT